MSRRSKSYNEMIAEKMRDPEFARGVVLHSVEFGDSVEEALQLAIRSMGIKEFSDRSGLPLQSVSSFVQNRKKFGYKRLTQCLAVFGLKFTVTRDKAA